MNRLSLSASRFAVCMANSKRLFSTSCSCLCSPLCLVSEHLGQFSHFPLHLLLWFKGLWLSFYPSASTGSDGIRLDERPGLSIAVLLDEPPGMSVAVPLKDEPGLSGISEARVSGTLVAGVLGRVSNSNLPHNGAGVSGLLVSRRVLGLLEDIVVISSCSSSSSGWVYLDTESS